jgi:hypothetical protein
VRTFRVTAGDQVDESIGAALAPWQQFTFGFTALSGPTLVEFVNFRTAFSLNNVSVAGSAAIPTTGARGAARHRALALLGSCSRNGVGA